MRSVDTLPSRNDIETVPISLDDFRAISARLNTKLFLWLSTGMTQAQVMAFWQNVAKIAQQQADSLRLVEKHLSEQPPDIDLDTVPEAERKSKAWLMEYLLQHPEISLPMTLQKGGETYIVKKLDLQDEQDFSDLCTAWGSTDDKKRHGRFGNNFDGDLILDPLRDLREQETEIYVLCSMGGSILASVDITPDLRSDILPENRLSNLAYANLAAPKRQGLVSDLVEIALARYNQDAASNPGQLYVFIESANPDSRQFFSKITNRLKQTGIPFNWQVDSGDREYWITVPTSHSQFRQAA